MKTWEDSLRAKLNEVVHGWHGFVSAGPSLDRTELELERDTPDFTAIAALAFPHAAMEDTNDEVAKDRLFELLTKKQHDYGHGNIMKHHIGGLKVRMWDKVARLRNLTEVRGNSAAVDESIGETWDDVFGYAVIGMMLLDGTFTLPLAADVEVESDWYEDAAHTPDEWFHIEQNESIIGVAHEGVESYSIYSNTDGTWEVYGRPHGRLPERICNAKRVTFHG